jgi:hypothetical protein
MILELSFHGLDVLINVLCIFNYLQQNNYQPYFRDLDEFRQHLCDKYAYVFLIVISKINEKSRFSFFKPFTYARTKIVLYIM